MKEAKWKNKMPNTHWRTSIYVNFDNSHVTTSSVMMCNGGISLFPKEEFVRSIHCKWSWSYGIKKSLTYIESKIFLSPFWYIMQISCAHKRYWALLDRDPVTVFFLKKTKFICSLRSMEAPFSLRRKKYNLTIKS